MDALGDAAPMNVEGGIRMDRFPTAEEVRKAEKVTYLRFAEAHRGRCAIEIDFYVLIRDAYGPKQAIWSKARIEVVDLVTEGNCPHIEIQSNEAESTPVLLPINPDVDPLHEAHVSVEGEPLLVACVSICPRSSSLDLCHSNGAVEICDGRRFDARCHRKDVEKLPSYDDASGNRFGSCTIAPSQCLAWYPES
jgi:hypothetical protein